MPFRSRVIAALLCLMFSVLAACTGDNAGITLSENAEDGSQIGDGGSFDPVADGSVSPCTTDDEGECVEQNENTDAVTFGVTSIDFGLNELDGAECETLAIPSGLSFEAEIDDVGDSEQFAFLTSGGAYSAERAEGSGSLSVCYLRSETGTHSGQLKLVLDAGAETPAYAYVIPMRGETSATFFTIASPRENQVIDENRNEGVNDDEGDYLLTAQGSVNLDLVSILKDGAETPIIVTSAGVKYKATLASDGSFSTTIGVPQTPGLYTVSFAAETAAGAEITKSVGVVVADEPELEIFVKDSGGNDVSAGVPSDAQELVVGFRVKNLNLSGPNAGEMTVAVGNVTWDGAATGLGADLWYESGQSWCPSDGEAPAEAGEDYSGFDAETTYCVPLASFGEISSGQHVITAAASNSLGETSASFILLLDYNKPTITISAPAENQLLETGATTLTLSGTVTNYAPLDDSASAPAAEAGDTGSYCLAADTDDSSCPESGVRLWLNSSTEQNPVYVYPQLPSEYDGLSADEIHAKIFAATPERCREIETTATDATTGESVTTAKTRCNLPSGSFSFQIDLPGEKIPSGLNLYANVLEMRADGLAGSLAHRTIAIRTFSTGKTNPHSFTAAAKTSGTGKVRLAATGDLTAGALGALDDSTGVVERSPLMLNLSEGILKDPNLLYVVQKLLNDNLPFSDVANGWITLPTEDDGETIDLEADYQRQYKEETGRNYVDFWGDLEDEYKEKFIHQGLHGGSMAMKYWALVRYLGYGIQKNWWSVDNAYLNFFERQGDPQKDFNTALDSCDQVITTAFVPLGDLRYVYEHMGYDPDMIPFIPEWPDIAAGDVEFDDFVSGKWVVQSVEFKEGTGNTGSIDIDACLLPANTDVNNCEDEIPYTDDLLPAFWGHFTSYNLVEGGLLGPEQGGMEIDDPTMPLIWSVGKIRVKLKDVIKLEKVQVDGKWTNKLSLDTDGIGQSNVEDSKIIIATSPDDPDLTKGDTLHDKATMGKNSIQIYPYERCRDYYQELLDSGVYHDSGEGWNNTPFGCDQDDEDWNYPFVLERNSVKGRDLYNTIFAQGQSYYILGVVWQGVMETFAKMIRCMDEEMVNPLLNPEAFPYPAWVPESDRMDTTFALDQGDDGLSLVSADEAQNPLFTLDLNLTQADLNVNDPDDATSRSAFTLRLPFEVTANDVPNPDSILSLAKPSSLMPATTIAAGGVLKKSDATDETANVSGHLIRGGDMALGGYPLSSDDPENASFAGISLNLEELVNSLSYMIYKKGPLSLLDLFESDDFDTSLLETDGDYSIGIDKVVLARYDLCGDIAGLLSTDLPPDLLFTNIASEFDYPATHLDVILDKNYPPTLALSPITGYEGTEDEAAVAKYGSDIKIGLTNVRISVKELENTDVENEFEVGREVVRIRVDGVLSLKAIYHPDALRFNVFVSPYDEQNLHFSTVPGKGGASYDDVNVIATLAGEHIPNAFGKIAKSFDPRLTDEAAAEITPSFSVQLKESGDGRISIHSFDDIEFTSYADAVENGTCEGAAVPYYTGETPASGTTAVASKTSVAVPMTQFDASNLASLPALKPLAASESSKTASKSRTAALGRIATDIGKIEIKPDGLLFGQDCSVSPLNDDNPLEEALCDLGIKDVLFTPTFEFDNDHGYLHMSSDLALKIYDWLVDEMN